MATKATKAELEAQIKNLKARIERLEEDRETLQSNLTLAHEHYQVLAGERDYWYGRLKDSVNLNNQHPGLSHCEGCAIGAHFPPEGKCCHMSELGIDVLYRIDPDSVEVD